MYKESVYVFCCKCRWIWWWLGNIVLCYFKLIWYDIWYFFGWRIFDVFFVKLEGFCVEKNWKKNGYFGGKIISEDVILDIVLIY